MKKLLVVLAAIILIATVASAQNLWGQGKMSYGGGVELALPMGDWGNAVGTGFGVFGLFQYGLNQDMLITGQLGYTMWSSKDWGGGYKGKASSFEILGGVKYNLSKQVTPGFYALGQLGIHAVSTTTTTPSSPGITFGGVTYGGYAGGDVTGSASKFVINLGVGYQYTNFDASVKYVINGDISNLAINVAYVVPL